MDKKIQTSGYNLLTSDKSLPNKEESYRAGRLRIEREAAEQEREKAIKEHLKGYASDPWSQYLGRFEFEQAENEQRKKDQKLALEKERKVIADKYPDDPLQQTLEWGKAQIEKTKNPLQKQAFDEQVLIDKLLERDRNQRALDKMGMGNAFLRESIGAAVGTYPKVAGPLSRGLEAVGLVDEGTTDALYRGVGDFEASQQQAREDDLSPWLSRMYGGTASSFLQARATPGGPYAKMIGLGVMAGDQSLTTARDAGLEGMDRLRYGFTQGALETTIAAIGQKIFGPGFESRMAGQAVAAQTWKELGKHMVLDAAKEAPEELLTTIFQDVSSKLEGVTPNLTFNDFVTNATEAVVQAVMMSPMVNTPNAVKIAINGSKSQQQESPQPESQPGPQQQPPQAEPVQPEKPVVSPIEEFMQNPSRTKYDAAVNAGMEEIPNGKSRKVREKWVEDTKKRQEQQAAQETPPGTLPESWLEEATRQYYEGVQNEGQQGNQEQQQGEQRIEGRQGGQGLLTETPSMTEGSSAAVPESPKESEAPSSKPIEPDSPPVERGNAVSLDDLEPNTSGMRKDSEEYWRGREIPQDKGDWYALPRVREYPDGGKTVSDGRHRIQEAIQQNKEDLIAVQETMNDEGDIVDRQFIRIQLPKQEKTAPKESEAPSSEVPMTHRRRTAELRNGHILFSADPERNTQYGKHVWELQEKLPHVSSDEKLIRFAMNYLNVDRDEAISQLNPDNIVDSARLWDDEQFVSDLWQYMEPKGYSTDDGAVVLDTTSAKLRYYTDSEPESQTPPAVASTEQASPDQSVPKPTGPVVTPEETAAAPKQKTERPVQNTRRGTVGDKLVAGEVVQTSSGRETTPFPKISTNSERKLSMTLRRVEEWLQKNALAEAESRGDEFNALQFRNENPGKIPKAVKDSMEEYLFGQQPDVPQSIFKTPDPGRLVVRDIATGKETIIPEKTKPLPEQPAVEYPESSPVVEDYFGTKSARVMEWSKTDTPDQSLKPKEYAAVYRDGNRVAAGLVEKTLKNAVDINSDGRTQRFFYGKEGNQFVVGRPKQRQSDIESQTPPATVSSPEQELAPPNHRGDSANQAVTPPPASGVIAEPEMDDVDRALLEGLTEALAPKKQPEPKTEEPSRFESLPEKSKARFNKAFDEKNVSELGQMIDRSNLAWREEFQKRTGIKLPRGVKAGRDAVANWAAGIPQAQKKKRSALGEKTGAAREKTGNELDAALDEFGDEMRNLGTLAGVPLKPQAVKAVVKLITVAVKHDIVTFADFVVLVAERFGEAAARNLAPYLEKGWNVLRQVDGYGHVGQTGKVEDVLTERGFTNATGNTDTGTGEKNQVGGKGTRRKRKRTKSRSGDQVLEGESATDGETAAEPGDTAGVRGGAAGEDAGGNAEVDSGTVTESERGRKDSGGASADESGGRGRDRAPKSTRPNYHLTNPEAIVGGGPKAKFARNQKAIEIVRELEETGRAPTAEELDTLAGYTGWGAFGQELFQGTWESPVVKKGWEDENEWLRTYLGEAEWRSANDSIVNAHYTDPQTVTGIWDMLRRMGFTGGRVLEPSMGIGNFFSLMPRDMMERSQLTGIELDKMTAKIASILHPDANIQQKGYQESQTPNDFYDVVVSNVPFGNYKIPDRRYKQDFSIHNYFFKRGFDQVKPGGVVAFITSNMTMDGKTQAKLMRAQIARDGGELVAAIRLPSGAFQSYAGTKVVADLIIIRKRKPGETENTVQKWDDVVEVDTPAGQPISVNEYWVGHPENILGTMTWGHGTTSGRPGMIVNQPEDLQARLDAAVASLPENIINTERAKSEGRERANTTAMRQNSVIAQDGDLWIVKGEQLLPLIDQVAWYRKGSKQATIDKNRRAIESLLEVREAMRVVLDQQAASKDATDARADLNRTYDSFVAEHGPIGKSAAIKNLWRVGDPMANTLYALEKVTGKVFKKYEKRPIFERATVRQKRSVDNPTVDDAFAIERNRSLDIDLQRIADAARMPIETVTKQLEDDGKIYKTGNGTYDAADVFLSGNMARKLRQLEAAQSEGMEGLERSIEAVRERIPEAVPYSQIEAKLGATWIDGTDYAEFVGSLLNEPADAISVERRINGWKVSLSSGLNAKTEATNTHGHPSIEFSKLVTAAMNNATVRITTVDADGNRVTDPVATSEANAKIDTLRENFPTWLWATPDRITRLSQAYNEEFNSTVTPEFDDITLQFEGMAVERGDQPFQLRQHQQAAIWRGIVSGKGLFAHEVGTGKTLTMAGLAMESRRLGLASKPLLLAHNANSLAVRNEIQEAYPGANILYVDNLDATRKQATLQSIATEDWDLIVVPHSMSENFQLRPETVRQLLQPEMEALEAAAREAFEESDASDFAKGVMPLDLDNVNDDALKALKEPTAKELVKERMKLVARITKATQAMDKGDGIFFEDMGVDMVMVDEAHLFKKLPITTRQQIKGLNKNASQMGTMLMMLTDYIRTNNNGRGVYLFTGTPITNTINEIYNMMRFVMAEEMEAANVRQWDAWFNNFAMTESLTELSSGGTWENFDRLSSFVNLPELRQMVGQYMDIVFADDMPEFTQRDSREGRSESPIGRPFKQIHNIIVNMLPSQRAHSEELKRRYEKFRDAQGRDKVRMMREPGGRFNPLVIEGEGVKLAMDPRLLGYGTKQVGDGPLETDSSVLDPRDPGLKINMMLQNAMTHYHEHPKATQMIFMQVGYNDWVTRTEGRTPAGDPIRERYRVFNLAKEIRRRLIEEGVPAEQIAIFSGMSKEKRTLSAEQMRNGDIRFAIGSTETMGTGVNAQDELVAMHHLDAPWMPGDLEQRNGRGHRQGNKWNTVHEYRYLTEGPQDGRRWQVLLTKDRFIKEFMRGDSKARVIDMDSVDMSEDGSGTDMEQSFSAAAGDPRIMQKIRLEGQVEKLKRQKNNHARTVTETVRQANKKIQGIKDAAEVIDHLEGMHATWMASRTDTPEVVIRGKTLFGAKDINEELKRLEERYANAIHPMTEIGMYRGVPMFLNNGTIYLGTGRTYDSLVSSVVTARWSLNSLQSIMANLPERVKNIRADMESNQRFIDMANEAVGKPFPKQQQLDSKQKQLDQIELELHRNPTVSPAWLRAGAPIGTDVYWNGEKHEVTGHRGDDTVLYSEGDDFRSMPAAELTDADGTRLFPDLEVKAKPEEQTALNTAKQRQHELQVLKSQYANTIRKEWKILMESMFGTDTDGEVRNFSGVPITENMGRAIVGYMATAIKSGVKSFEIFIRETLQKELSNDIIRGIAPGVIAAWNSLKDKAGLDEATMAMVESVLDDTQNADMEKAIEAAIGEQRPEPVEQPSVETAPAAHAPAEPADRLFSTQNAASAETRSRLGIEERSPVDTLARETSVELAKVYSQTKVGSDYIDMLIQELSEQPRAVSPYENDLLNARNAELGNKLEDALKRQIEARKSGDSVKESVAATEATNHRVALLALIENVLEPMGTAAGRALQARKAWIDSLLTLSRHVLEYSAAYGKDPSKQQVAEWEQKFQELEADKQKLQKLLDEEKAKNEDLEARLKEAHEAAVDKVRKKKPTKASKPDVSAPVVESRESRVRKKIDATFKEINQLLKGSETTTNMMGVGGAAKLTALLTKLAVQFTELGVVKLGDFLQRVKRRMGPAYQQIEGQATEAWKSVQSSRPEADLSMITGKIDVNDPDSIGRAARDLHGYVIERDGLDASASGREAAVDAVHAILSQFVPGITGAEVSRAMSGIGIYSELSKGEIEVIRRDQKAQLLLLEQLKDWERGQAPPATGQERAPISDEQRELRRAVNAAKKASGVSTATAGQLRSALDAAKRGARNRIADLTKAIESGERIAKSQQILQSDAELNALRSERDELQKRYDEAFGKPELSDEQRLNRAEKALDRAISSLEADLKSGKLYPDVPKGRLTSPSLEAKQATLDALKANRDELRLSSGEAQQRSDAEFERRLRERDAELTRRLAEGDFKPKPKKQERAKTPEMLRLGLSIEKKTRALMDERKRWEFDNRHPIYKALVRGVVTPPAILRKTLTSFEQSLIGRQGWLLGITNPKIYGKSIRSAFPSNPLKAKSLFPTEQDLFNVQSALDADEDWVRLEKTAKLAVTDVHGGINREEENLFVPEWVNKLPGLGGSERAASAFINSLRRLVFRSLVEKLAPMADGKRQSLTAADLEVIGHLVNVSTGRGRSGIAKFDSALTAASVVFFSPRWWLSRLQWWTGQPMWRETRWFGGKGVSPGVRSLVVKEWSKQAAAQVAIIGLVTAALYAAFGPPGDDEEWDFGWRLTDPNFGKIRIGNTQFDLTAGLGQHLAFVSRIGFGTQAGRWETTEVDKWRLFTNYGRGKLAPVPSMFVDYLAGKSVGGEEFGSPGWIRDALVPLAMQDVWDARNEDPALAAGIAAAVFFGIGTQSYSERIKERNDTVNELRAMQTQGKSQEQINELLRKHFAHQASLEAKQALRTETENTDALQKVADQEDSPELEAAIQKEKGDLALMASVMLSTEDRTQEKSAKTDEAITTARALLKATAPTFDEANKLFTEAYHRRNGSTREYVGGLWRTKKNVAAARRRLYLMYKE